MATYDGLQLKKLIEDQIAQTGKKWAVLNDVNQFSGTPTRFYLEGGNIGVVPDYVPENYTGSITDYVNNRTTQRNSAADTLRAAGIDVNQQDIDAYLGGQTVEQVKTAKDAATAADPNSVNNKRPGETVEQWQARVTPADLIKNGQANQGPPSSGNGQVTGYMNGVLTTFTSEEAARQNGATNIQSGSLAPDNASSSNDPGTGGTGSGAGGISNGLPSTGNQELDAILARMDQMIQQNIANGQKINPNIEITPEEVQKFIDQAEKEIGPYYSNQIRSIKDDLTKNLQYMQKQYDLDKQSKEAQFKNELSGKRENLAGAGLAFSGVRGAQEQSIQADQNRTLESSALAASKAASDAVRSTEQKIGSRNLADLQLPGMTNYTASLEGAGGFNSGRSLDFGTLGDVTGSVEYSQRGDTRALSDFYKNQEIQKRTLNFQG